MSLSFQISFFTKRIRGSWKKWLISGLRQIQHKMSLFVLEKKEEFRECWGYVTRKQKQLKGAATGQILDNLSIKIYKIGIDYIPLNKIESEINK